MLIAPTRRELRFFSAAAKASQNSDFERVNIGAVIVKGNYVVSRGWNQNKGHTCQHHLNVSNGYYPVNTEHNVGCLHAEVHALIKSGRQDLTGCEIFVYRNDCNGMIANCRPCKACLPAIRDAGITHMYFTNSQGYNYERI